MAIYGRQRNTSARSVAFSASLVALCRTHAMMGGVRSDRLPLNPKTKIEIGFH